MNIYSSALYESKSSNLTHSDKVSIAIELLSNCIFLALYAKQVKHAITPNAGGINNKSISLIVSAINSTKASLVPYILSGEKLNPIEEVVITKLSVLSNSILNDRSISRIINSTDQIDAIFDQSTFSEKLTKLVKSSIFFTLSIANQIDLNVDSFAIPYLRIFTHVNKSIVTFPVRFSLNRDIIDDANPSLLWYRIFKGLIFQNENKADVTEKLKLICLAINIGIIPDVQSGLGLTCFSFESYFTSDTLRKFVNESNSFIYNKSYVINALYQNNKDLFVETQSALEADFTDQVAPEDDGTTLNEDPGNEEDQDPTENTDTATDPDVSASEDPSDETIPEEPTDPPQEDNPLSGQDNPEESTPKLLGFDVKLAVKETLDTFLYKVSVARFIDNAIEFNHDDLPTEKVSILRKWKSMMLFLADAEETKRLLKSLKIKL